MTQIVRVGFALAVAAFAAAPTAAVEPKPPLGHRSFYPTGERPVGWRGDGNGAFPGAAPVTQWWEGTPAKTKVKFRGKRGEVRERTVWDLADGKSRNVVWKTRMPAWANSQPIVVGDKAFTTAEPHTLLCVDMRTGQVLWQKSNSPLRTLPLSGAQLRAVEDYLARLYAARVPVVATVGNYRRLPSPWKKQYADWLLDRLHLAERVFGELVAQNPLGERARSSWRAFQRVVDEVEALNPGDDCQKLGGRLVKPFEQAARWIRDKYRFHPLLHWDGYTGWTWPTPCSDGKFVYAVMGQGQAVCYDLDGHLKWAQFIPLPEKHAGPRANHVPSPVLAGDVLIAQMMEALVGFDKRTGEILWRDRSIKVGGGYRVGSHKALKLSSGRRILVTTAGKALDVRTGEVVADFGLKAYGAEGAGASIVGRGSVAYIVGDKSRRSPVMAAIRFTPDGDAVRAEQLWEVRYRQTPYSPVLHDGRVYRFTERGRGGDTFRAADGEVTEGVSLPRGTLRYASPILAGDTFIGFDSGGSRSRVDGRNVVPVRVLRRTSPTEAETVSEKNLLDATAAPPDPRVQRYAPEAYELNCWGLCGGIPKQFAHSSPFAQGNRLLIRTISDLVCIGDPDEPYDAVTPE